MSLTVTDECLGCGGCEFSCPHEAISQGTDFVVRFTVDPILCNDCGECIPLCPEDALVEDPAFAVCNGRGCPMSSSRMAEWECSEGLDRCGACGAMLWKKPGGSEFACPRCDLGMKVICPKVRRLETLATV